MRRKLVVSALLAMALLVASRLRAQSCGDLGGDYCSQSGSCPGGRQNLGVTYDCNPCCQSSCTPHGCGGQCGTRSDGCGGTIDCGPCGSSCGDLGGDYCSQNGSCPSGYQSLGSSYDCHPCCQSSCTPHGCGAGQCGQQSDGCGGTINCGPCGQSCGALGGDYCSQNGSCPSGYQSLGATYDCHPCCDSVCVPHSCGASQCGTQSDGCGGTIDCGPCGSSCGELGGNYCSQSGSCPSGYQGLGATYDCHPCCQSVCTPQICAPGQCGTHSDGCGGTIECGACDQSCGAIGGDYCSNTGACPGGYQSLGSTYDCNPCCQTSGSPLDVCHPNPCSPGDVCTRECHLGIDGQNYCEPHCSPNLCPVLCAAGCARPPQFTISPETPSIIETVTFAADPALIDDPTPDWDWGDGTHCVDCRPTETHRYTRVGSYLVRLTAKEPKCQTVQTSFAQVVAVHDVAVHRGDYAKVVSHTLPRQMCNEPVEVSVTMLNMGQTDWRAEDGYKLGAVGDQDDFSDEIRIALPAGVVVHPHDMHTFTFTLHPHPYAGTYVTDWKMVHESVQWFGEPAQETVEVDPHCSVVAPPPPAPDQFHCEITALDGYDVPLVGKPVTLQVYSEERGDRTLVDENNGVTGSDGRAFLSVNADPANFLDCRVDLGSKGRFTRQWKHSVIPPIPGGTVLHVDAVAAPVPTEVVEVLGAKPPPARVALYRAGAYDKVIVLTEPMNPQEQAQGARSLADLWFAFAKLMKIFHDRGYDVWLVNTSRTGQNIHEQAAEAAQAIQLAAHDYPTTHGITGFSGQVAVAGVSLGGVTARLATARWDSPAPSDAAWRTGLGISGPPPVNLLAFIDSPLRGATVSMDLQNFLWSPPLSVSPISLASQFNLNSCAFQQLVNESIVGGLNCQSNPGPSCNHDAFFSTGLPVKFPGGGTCDRPEGGSCVCDAGPALLTLNGDGFPRGVRKISYSDGTWSEPNRCYGDERDRNAAGEDLCFDSHGIAFTPQVGSLMYQVICDGDAAVDMRFREADRVSGSRQAAFLANAVTFAMPVTCDEMFFKQYASGTFIPITSSMATDTPGCGPFNACMNAGFSGTHVNPPPAFVGGLLIPELERAFATTSSAGLAPFAQAVVPNTAPIGQAIALDGHASSDPDGHIVQHEWSLGDGTVTLGPTAEHTYTTEGTYTVALTVTDDSGKTDTTAASLRVGPPNRPPDVHVSGPSAPFMTGQLLGFDASASRDPEGSAVEYHWSFGDGTLEDGPSVVHAYAMAGDYDVRLTAMDDEGAAAAWSTVITVSGRNSPPTGTISHSANCTASACSVTFTVAAVDPDGDDVAIEWSGCGIATGKQVTCARSSPGTLDTQAILFDGLGASSSASASVRVSAASYLVGGWSPCTSAQPYTCTANTPAGCSRPGAQSRSVVVETLTVNGADVPAPPTSQQCTDTAPGYVASYAATYDANWTCTASGANGCFKNLVSSAPATFSATGPSVAAPVAKIYTIGYVASWYVGPWSGCSASCGGGWQTRAVQPNGWRATAPDAGAPSNGQSCNTQSCQLSCYDYGLYPTWPECYGAGWAFCDTRYRDDGVGGLLTCRHGYN